MSSMAFDAICYLEQRLYANNHNNPQGGNFIKKINDLCGDKLGNSCVGMSSLCFVLTVYAPNLSFETLSLDELKFLFNNPEDVRSIVRERVTNEFLASFIFPLLDDLVVDKARLVQTQLDILKNTGFEQLWRTDLLPGIIKVIEAKKDIYSNTDLDSALFDIQKLKQNNLQNDINIYITSLSCGVAFTLANDSFLEPSGNGGGVWVLLHELMHGFASDEAVSYYLKYVEGDSYLSEQHKRLLVISGNEEEFVAAAEYYLRMKYNNENKHDLLNHARRWYDGKMPTSVLLFDLLSQEINTPNGYNQWLIDVFKNNKLPQTNITEHLQKLAPQ